MTVTRLSTGLTVLTIAFGVACFLLGRFSVRATLSQPGVAASGTGSSQPKAKTPRVRSIEDEPFGFLINRAPTAIWTIYDTTASPEAKTKCIELLFEIDAGLAGLYYKNAETLFAICAKDPSRFVEAAGHVDDRIVNDWLFKLRSSCVTNYLGEAAVPMKKRRDSVVAALNKLEITDERSGNLRDKIAKGIASIPTIVTPPGMGPGDTPLSH